MIYDCFLFNDELDILKLRLTYMSKYVDRFVIGESTHTLSGHKKPLYYLDNIHQFSEFKDKITHLIIPQIQAHDAWEREHYQRSYLKTGIINCSDNDLIIIADVDEFVDINYLLSIYTITKPNVIEMPLYYYFINLKTNVLWRKTLITPFLSIKNVNIGNREKYHDLNPDYIKGQKQNLGWHFSYLFGFNTQLYINKLKSFSHQEYNTPYFLDPKRITTCIKLGIDFLERNSIYEVVTDLRAELPAQLIAALNMTNCLKKLSYQKPDLSFYLNFYHLKYLLKFILKPTLRNKLIALKLLNNTKSSITADVGYVK